MSDGVSLQRSSLSSMIARWPERERQVLITDPHFPDAIVKATDEIGCCRKVILKKPGFPVEAQQPGAMNA